MKIFRHLFRFYINGSIHVSLSCLALFCITQQQLFFSSTFSLALFVFLGTVFAYNFVKYESLIRRRKNAIRKELKAIVWGDSHANAVVGAVASSSEKHNGHVLSWTSSGCPTVMGIQSQAEQSYNCSRQIQRFLAEVQRFPSDTPVIVVNRLNAYLHGNNESQDGQPKTYVHTPYSSYSREIFQKEIIRGYEQAICQLSKSRPVYVLQPIPEMGKNVLNEELKYSMILHQGLEVKISKLNHLQRSQLSMNINSQLAQQCGVKLLNPLPYLCNDKQCFGSQNNVPYYFDDDHLNLRGARRLMPLFEPIVQ